MSNNLHFTGGNCDKRKRKKALGISLVLLTKTWRTLGTFHYTSFALEAGHNDPQNFSHSFEKMATFDNSIFDIGLIRFSMKIVLKNKILQVLNKSRL